MALIKTGERRLPSSAPRTYASTRLTRIESPPIYMTLPGTRQASTYSEPDMQCVDGFAGVLTPLDNFQPRPGQLVIALSAACVAQFQASALASWPELHRGLLNAQNHPCEVCWLELPEIMEDATILAVCRAAHEIWIFEREPECSDTAAKLLRFRTESAPPSMGERKSVLHAPEVGCIRLWQPLGSGVAECQSSRPTEPDTNDLTKRMGTIATLLCGLDSASPEQWTQMAATLRHQADRLRHRVRVILAALFALTATGMVVLQLLSMSSLNIPMADLYSVFFLWVGTVYLWGRKLQWNEVQLAWLALAEALDVQALLRNAGLADGTITALYQLRHRQQIEWIREALRPMTWAAHCCRPTAPQSAHAVLSAWVPRALKLHQDMAGRQSAKAIWLGRGMKFCYGIGGVLTLLVITGGVSSPSGSMAVSTGIGLASSLGTLLLIFNGVLGFAQDAALHRHLAGVFARAQRCLAHEMSPHEYEELLADLGQECVQLAAERTLL